MSYEMERACKSLCQIRARTVARTIPPFPGYQQISDEFEKNRQFKIALAAVVETRAGPPVYAGCRS